MACSLAALAQVLGVGIGPLRGKARSAGSKQQYRIGPSADMPRIVTNLTKLVCAHLKAEPAFSRYPPQGRSAISCAPKNQEALNWVPALKLDLDCNIRVKRQKPFYHDITANTLN